MDGSSSTSGSRDRREQRFGSGLGRSIGQPVLGRHGVGRDLDAAGMQLFGNGEIVDRCMRRRGLCLVGRRCGDEFVEQRSEIAILAGAHDSLLCLETCELSLSIQAIAAER